MPLEQTIWTHDTHDTHNKTSDSLMHFVVRPLDRSPFERRITATRTTRPTASRGRGTFATGFLHVGDFDGLAPAAGFDLGRGPLDHPFAGADDVVQFFGFGEENEQVVVLLLDVERNDRVLCVV